MPVVAGRLLVCAPLMTREAQEYMGEDAKSGEAVRNAIARRSKADVAALQAKATGSLRRGWLAMGLSFGLAVTPLAASSGWLTPALLGAGGMFLIGAKEFMEGVQAKRQAEIAVLAGSLSRNVDDNQIQQLALSLTGAERDVGAVAGWAKRIEQDAERKGVSPAIGGPGDC